MVSLPYMQNLTYRSTYKETVTLRARGGDATNDLHIVAGAIKYSAAQTGANTLRIDVAYVTAAKGTWYVRSFRVYALQ